MYKCHLCDKADKYFFIFFSQCTPPYSLFPVVRSNYDFFLSILHLLDVRERFFSVFPETQYLQKLCCPKDELNKKNFPNPYSEKQKIHFIGNHADSFSNIQLKTCTSSLIYFLQLLLSVFFVSNFQILS